MTVRAVHWHDGMFLRPHHFQAATRQFEHRSHRAQSWDRPYCWGLRSIEIDSEALANYRFVIRSLRAIFRDGTPVEIPADAVLPALDLKAAFASEGAMTIYLALPVLNLGKANVTDPTAPDEVARFKLSEQELEDENTGVNPQVIMVRELNIRLLFSSDDRAGFEVLPIARVERSSGANAVPQLDVAFIPPLLACDAWPVMVSQILQPLYDRIGRKIDRLASQLVSRQAGRVTFDTGDELYAGQLRVLNEAYAVLGVLSFAQGMYPVQVYSEMCRVAGQLSIFDPSRRVPPLPAYDHDDLGGCFWRVKTILDALLDIFLEPEYKERPFLGSALRMQVALDPSWLDAGWEYFIGVTSDLEPDETVRLLTVAGQLDMKIGSGDRVDQIYQLGQAGLKFESKPRPKLLPEVARQVFFRVLRSADQREWQNVMKSQTLAVRVNETRLNGPLQGQRQMTIRTGPNQTARMQFTLFAIPQSE